MSTRRDPIFTFAICASLVAHTAILLILAGKFVDSLPPLALGPLRTNQAAAAVLVIHPPSRPPPPPSYLLFGDAKGIGDAANGSPGDEPMRGRDGGQVQAYLSRDPVGPASSEEAPSMSVLPRGAMVPPQPMTAAVHEPEPPSPPDLPDAPEPPLKVIGIAADGLQAWSVPHIPRPQPQPQAVPAPPDDRPGAAQPPADAAIMSDSESDAFAKGNSVEFRDGRVDVRFGRKVKTVRPQLSYAARFDLMAMPVPRMVVRVKVDSAGNVRLVDVVKSTGSESADQAVKVALYQWWFEPPKDKSGATLGDVVEFPIVWR